MSRKTPKVLKQLTPAHFKAELTRHAESAPFAAADITHIAVSGGVDSIVLLDLWMRAPEALETSMFTT